MQKENQPARFDYVELVINYLKSVNFAEPKRANEVYQFFSKHAQLTTEHELFDDADYRLEYANNLNWMSEMGYTLKDRNDVDVETAFFFVVDILERALANKEKEILKKKKSIKVEMEGKDE